MDERCTECGQNFEPEPGFYYGAMFISYIIMGWLFLGIAAFLIWVAGWSVNASLFTIVAIDLLFFIYFYRLSRSIWIHLNIRYKSDALAD